MENEEIQKEIVPIVQPQDTPIVEQEQAAKWYEKFNFKSEAEATEALTKLTTKPKTEEEIKREKEREEFEVDQYAITNNLVSRDEIIAYEKLKSADKKEVVFNDFKKEFLEDNPNADEDEVQDAFNDAYHINSGNDFLQKKGQKKLEAEFRSKIEPLEGKRNKAKEGFITESEVRKSYPTFEKSIQSEIDTLLPEKLEIHKGKYEDDDISVDIDLDKKEIEELKKEIAKSEEAFYHFRKNDKESLKKVVDDKVELWKWRKYGSTMQEKIGQAYATAARKKVAIGAENPFPLQQPKNNAEGNVDPIKAVLKSLGRG